MLPVAASGNPRGTTCARRRSGQHSQRFRRHSTAFARNLTPRGPCPQPLHWRRAQASPTCAAGARSPRAGRTWTVGSVCTRVGKRRYTGGRRAMVHEQEREREREQLPALGVHVRPLTWYPPSRHTHNACSKHARAHSGVRPERWPKNRTIEDLSSTMNDTGNVSWKNSSKPPSPKSTPCGSKETGEK